MVLSFLLIVCLSGRAMATEPFSDIVDLYKEWCPTPCSIDSNLTKTFCCGYSNCKCLPENCYEQGNCCLEEFVSLDSARQSLGKSLYVCLDPNYHVDNEQYTENGYNGYKVIGRCNTSTPEPVVKDLCENPDVNKSLYSIIPVTDQTFHYRNQFCAMCNDNANLVNITHWDIEHECDDSKILTHANILYILKQQLCSLKFVYPIWTKGERCVPHPISTCNVTGHWPEYNEMIDLSCNSFQDTFNATYKNVFCYLCNTDKPILQDDQYCSSINTNINAVHAANPPFLALLDLGIISRTFASEELQCNILTQFKDIKMGLCRDILCDQSRYVSYDGKCIPKQDYQDTVCYTMFLNMTITNAVSVEANLENVGLMYLYNMLSDDTGVTKVDMFIPVTKSRANYIISKTISYVLPAIALELFSHHDNMSFEIQVGMTLNVEIVSLNFQTNRDQSEVEVTSIDLTNNVILKKLEIPPEHLQQHGSACDDKESIPVDKLLECPFIKLDYTDFRMSILNGYLLFEDIDVKPFSRLRYREVNSSILICLSDYLKIYETMPEKARVPKESARFINEISSKNLVSLICICTSILSLFVTVVVIAASSELHSLPGFNTLCLCICLLLAQTFYQFGSGQTSLPGWTCAMIGGVCHFLWLSVMFSMHVCSVDMFLIFRKFRLVSHKAIGKKLLKRLVYICSVSLLFVGVNMVISVARSAGQDFGYGGIICYISSSVMQMVTFIIPSVIVVITNIVLFINVMFKISKASIHDLGLKQERNFFDIYARLSTLTGFTWIIGFLLILIKSDVLEYCFILLNASQGIFIMMAFVLNRRLWKCCQKNFTQTE